METAKKYLITCLNCKGRSKINILPNNQVMYVDHIPIIACRFRGDLQWGFECMCGNDSRLAPEEAKDINMLLAGSNDNVIKKILKTINVKTENKFNMEPA